MKLIGGTAGKIIAKYHSELETPTVIKETKMRGDMLVKLTGLKPNRYMYIFAANPAAIFVEVRDRATAYSETNNHGIIRTDSTGNAEIRLFCPMVYQNPEDGSIHPRHFHFRYANAAGTAWEPRIYTHSIIPTVPRARFLRAAKEYTAREIVDATKTATFPGAIHIPFTTSSKNVATILKSQIPDPKMPLYIAECNAADALITKLAKAGYHNVWKYCDGKK